MVIGIDARELQGRPTGAGRYARNLIRRWAEEGGDRLVAYFNGPAPLDRVLDHPTITKRPLGKPVRGLWWQERRLPAAAKEDRLDVFFAPAYSCPLSLDLPRVTAIHDVSFFSVPDDFTLLDAWRRRTLAAASMRVSKAVLACSDFTRREILQRFPDLGERLRHVPLGSDDDLPSGPSREEARRRLGVRGPLLLTVGAILNRRRLPDLLRALSRLVRSWPDLVLEIVGENRTHPRLDIPRLVRSLDLQRRVRLSGYLTEEELAERYAAADAAVFLSEYEGFGLPALEAMARGIPVVASARPSLGEILAGAALLVEPRDVGAVAEALDRALRKGGERDVLVARGRALAARFSWSETARLTRAVLESAAGR